MVDMSSDSMNEIFQWIAIVGIFLAVLALYRQFGVMMMGTRAYVTTTFGPAANSQIGNDYSAIFTDAPPAGHRLILFVSESCPTCEHLLEHLPELYQDYGEPQNGQPAPLQLAFVTSDSNEEFNTKLREAYRNSVITSPDRILHGKDGPTAEPFGILYSTADGKVIDKAIGHEIYELTSLTLENSSQAR
jgi:thiol-disulfide isomerase/thioredoxin